MIVPVQKAQLLERMLRFLPFSSPATPVLTNRTSCEICPVNLITGAIHARGQPEFEDNTLLVFEVYTKALHDQKGSDTATYMSKDFFSITINHEM